MNLPFSIAFTATTAGSSDSGACLLSGALPGAVEGRSIGEQVNGRRVWVEGTVNQTATAVAIRLVLVEGGPLAGTGKIVNVLAEHSYNASLATSHESFTAKVGALSYTVNVLGLGSDAACPYP